MHEIHNRSNTSKHITNLIQKKEVTTVNLRHGFEKHTSENEENFVDLKNLRAEKGSTEENWI